MGKKRALLGEVSSALHIVDYYLNLAPDGASPRSTSLMAALEHGLPMLVGKSPQMESYPDFESSILNVNPLNEKNAVDILIRLQENRDETESFGKKARLFYQRYFFQQKSFIGQ